MANSWLRAFNTFAKDVRIVSKELSSSGAGGSKLNLYDSQRRYLEEIGRGLDDDIHIFNILKSRQLGITTISIALIDVFWYAVHDNLLGCLVTDNEKNRNENRKLIEFYVKALPQEEYGDFRIVNSNRDFIQYSNGGRINLLVAGTKTKSIAWAEGSGYAVAHVTEVSKYGDAQGIKTLEEGFAQNNPHRLYVYESTANGFNHWRERWYAGFKLEHTQRSFFIGWWAHDLNVIKRTDKRFERYGYGRPTAEERERINAVAKLYGHRITPEQLAWIRYKEDTAGSEEGMFLQNNPWLADEAFVQTGYSFFQSKVVGETLKWVLENKRQCRAYRYEVDGDFFSFRMHQLEPKPENKPLVELLVWQEPVPGGKYVIGFDPAYGRTEHADRHVISVWRCFADKIVQVAEYATADVDVKYASWVCFHLCAAYSDMMCNVELGGPGALVMTEFKHLRELLGAEMNQVKVKAREWGDACANARWYLYSRPDSLGSGYMNNFETNFKEKYRLMHGYRGSFVSNELEIASANLCREMNNVIVKDEVIGAPESANSDAKDDRVFAAALAHRAWKDWRQSEMLAQGLTYERVMREESGNSTMVEKSVNSIVLNFLRRGRELEENPPDERDPWKVERGLA